MQSELDVEEACENEGADETPVRLMPVFSAEAFRRLVDYPVLVECWDKPLNRRRQAKYEEAFTPAEQRLLLSYRTKFRKWHLIDGPPRTVSLRLPTLRLLQRAVEFFAEL